MKFISIQSSNLDHESERYNSLQPAPGDIPSRNTFLQPKPKARKSHIYDKVNGETFMVDGKLRWQPECNRCTDPLAPRTFAAASTHNAINHLRRRHEIGPEGPIISGPSPSPLTIQSAFGEIAPKIDFNADIFYSMLIH